MRYLTVAEILELHRLVIEQSGGSPGLRDLGILESAAAQPQAAFAGEPLYPGLAEKAAALGFSLIKNHAFVDGNKRIGHATMETFLVLNGHEIQADVDEQERVIFDLAASLTGREDFTDWVRSRVRPMPWSQRLGVAN